MSYIKNIYDFLLSQRHSGTTTLMKEIASRNDVFVITADIQSSRNFNGKSLPLTTFRPYGHKRKPILIDNFALIKLCEEHLSEIEKKEIAIKNMGEYTKLCEQQISKQQKEIFELKNQTLLGFIYTMFKR